MLLNDKLLIKGILKKYFETIENENSTYQKYIWYMEILLRGKFIALSVYIKNRNISNKQSNDAS